jgi:hypothetical protein
LLCLFRIDQHLDLALLRSDDDRLVSESPDHVEGGRWRAAHRLIQDVLLNCFFDDASQLLLDPKEPVGRAHAFQALMRPLVVVVFDPKRNALLRFFEVFELGPLQELRPDGLPVALDLAQRHRMMRCTPDVMNTVLLQLHLELGFAAPCHVLPAVVAQEFLGHAVLDYRPAVDFQDVLAGLSAVNTEPDDVAAKIVDEPNQVNLTAAHPPAEDVGLPHLVGGGPLKEPRLRRVALDPGSLSGDEPLSV